MGSDSLFDEIRSIVTSHLRAEDSNFETGRVVQTISTSRLARDGAVIPADSWVLDAYRANPIVLWMHQSGSFNQLLPIARNVELSIDAQREELTSVNQFDMDDAFAREVLRKIQLGMINATSVRWLPIDRPRVEKRKVTNAAGEIVERDVVVFPRNELLEQSYVTVPADAGALIKRASGEAFDIEAYREANEPRGLHPSLVRAQADLMRRGLPIRGGA